MGCCVGTLYGPKTMHNPTHAAGALGRHKSIYSSGGPIFVCYFNLIEFNEIFLPFFFFLVALTVWMNLNYLLGACNWKMCTNKTFTKCEISIWVDNTDSMCLRAGGILFASVFHSDRMPVNFNCCEQRNIFNRLLNMAKWKWWVVCSQVMKHSNV